MTRARSRKIGRCEWWAARRRASASCNFRGGSLGTVVVDSQKTLPGRLESDLRLEGRQLKGSITNNLGAPLYDAAVILDYQVTRIGDFKAGETREVAVNLARRRLPGYGPPTSFSSLLYPAAAAAADRPTRPAETSWTRCSAPASTSPASKWPVLTLMGWLDGSLVELDVVDARPAEVRSTLLINSLPIHLSKGWEGELPALQKAGGSSAPPPSTASSSAATTSPTASRSRCSSACRGAAADS